MDKDERFLKISKEDYEHIARALVVYDHVVHRNGDRRRAHRDEISEVQERWLSETERFGATLTEDERDALIEEAYQEIDRFLEGETWHELAWWIAERECKRISAGCADREARDLVTDRLYHKVMEEFMRHGIDRLSLPEAASRESAPAIVSKALRSLRAQTRNMSGKSGSKRQGV